MLSHISIYDIYCKKQCFRKQFKVIVNLNHPVNKCRSYSFINFMLLCHICWITIPFFFNAQHVVLNCLNKFRDMINIIKSLSINLWNVAENLVVTSLMEHLQLLLKSYFRQFISRWSSVCWSSSFGLGYTKSTHRPSLICSLTLSWSCNIWMWVCS